MSRSHTSLWLVAAAVLNSPLVAQEFGTAEAYRADHRSQAIMSDAARSRQDKAAEEKARGLSERDRQLLIAASVAKKLSAIDNLANAKVGSLVCVRAYVARDGRAISPAMKIVDLVDAHNAIAVFRSAPPFSSQEFWLRGFDMKSRVDGDTISLDGFYAIAGAKKFDAVDGSTPTVLIVEPFDIGPIAAELDKKVVEQQNSESAAQAKAKAALLARKIAEHEAAFRKWNSNDYSGDALLASYSNGQVVLEKRDGHRIKAELSKLSGDDQKYVTDWLKKKRR